MKLIKLTDCQKEDIYNIFSIADELINGKYTDSLKGKSVVMFFPEFKHQDESYF